MKNILQVGFGIFLCLSAGYTSAMLAMMFAPAVGLDGPTWGAIIGCLVFAFAVLFLDSLKPRLPHIIRAGTPEAEELENRLRQETVTLPPDHPIVNDQKTPRLSAPAPAGERAILMRQINIWIVLGILLAFFAITHLLRDEREIRLEHLCDENPSLAECQE